MFLVHLDNKQASQPVAPSSPLASPCKLPGHTVQILRAVIPVPETGLHCGWITKAGTPLVGVVIPVPETGLHCGIIMQRPDATRVA